jgi:protein arginine kinase
MKDVVLSSRARVMRNLRGFKFPHKCTTDELLEVMSLSVKACRKVLPKLEVHKGLTSREREKLVGQRLISPNFPWTLPGRAVMISPDERLSIMVNEEDHLRIQVLDSSLTIAEVSQLLYTFLGALESELPFAQDDHNGYLSSSVFNRGEGRRYSVMLHLIGLGNDPEIGKMLQDLVSEGIAVRGLYGEGSRPIGAFTQVSSTVVSLSAFQGTIDFLIDRERIARETIGESILVSKAEQAMLYLKSSPRITLPDAFRILGWLRWATTENLEPYNFTLAQLDSALSSLDLLSQDSEEYADGKRADRLRKMLIDQISS